MLDYDSDEEEPEPASNYETMEGVERCLRQGDWGLVGVNNNDVTLIKRVVKDVGKIRKAATSIVQFAGPERKGAFGGFGLVNWIQDEETKTLALGDRPKIKGFRKEDYQPMLPIAPAIGRILEGFSRDRGQLGRQIEGYATGKEEAKDEWKKVWSRAEVEEGEAEAVAQLGHVMSFIQGKPAERYQNPEIKNLLELDFSLSQTVHFFPF